MVGTQSERQNSRIWVGRITEEVQQEDIRSSFAQFGKISEVKFVRKARDESFAFIQYEEREDAEYALRKGDGMDVCGIKVKVNRATPASKSDDQPRRRDDDFDNSRRRRADSAESTGRRRRRSESPRPDAGAKRTSYYDTNAAPVARNRSRSRERTSSFRVLIRNLPRDMTWQELKRLGGDYGKTVLFTRTWEERGAVSGIIEYSEKRDADALIKGLDGKKMEDSEGRLRVEMEEPEIKRGGRRNRSESPVDIRRDSRR